MSVQPPRKARLRCAIPQDRFRKIAVDAKMPDIGDVVILDQGFASPDGENMALVYGVGVDGNITFEAEVYDWELEPPD